MKPVCRLRTLFPGLVTVLACLLLAGTAKADPPAPAGTTRTVTMRARVASSTALTVASASGSSNAITLVATVDGKGTAPAGSVVFTLQGKRIGEVPVAHGAASMTVTMLPAGLSSIAASFQGDGNLLPSTSATVRFYQEQD